MRQCSRNRFSLTLIDSFSVCRAIYNARFGFLVYAVTMLGNTINYGIHFRQHFVATSGLQLLGTFFIDSRPP